jgi:hypothetical protein
MWGKCWTCNSILDVCFSVCEHLYSSQGFQDYNIGTMFNFEQKEMASWSNNVSFCTTRMHPYKKANKCISIKKI